ncbi:hypothetical protein EJB05_18620, partial [Eragrostis curvula]
MRIWAAYRSGSMHVAYVRNVTARLGGSPCPPALPPRSFQPREERFRRASYLGFFGECHGSFAAASWLD